METEETKSNTRILNLKNIVESLSEKNQNTEYIAKQMKELGIKVVSNKSQQLTNVITYINNILKGKKGS